MAKHEIPVRRVGGMPGFCRVLYKGVRNKRYYALQEDFHGVYNWYTATKSWEPDTPIDTEKYTMKVVS